MDLQKKTDLLILDFTVKLIRVVEQGRPHLLGVLKLPPETLIHSFGGFLWTAYHSLDVDLEATVQELVDLPVIVVVVSD